MKSIATVNCVLPTVDNELEYLSGESLRDFDVAIFDPKFPYMRRIEFTGGGSCISIESGQNLNTALSHWKAELRDALAAGKNIFVLLSDFESELVASGSTTTKNVRNYSTYRVDNYEVLPVKIGVRNAKGRHIAVADSTFNGLGPALKEFGRYNVILEPEAGKKTFITKDKAQIGGIVKCDGLPGHLVLLPYFDFSEYDESAEGDWTAEAIRTSHSVVEHLLAIDKALRQEKGGTPPPVWSAAEPKPAKVAAIDSTIEMLNAKIDDLRRKIDDQIRVKRDFLSFDWLLYENGTALEGAIKAALQLLGYTVENVRIDDLEIDHVITRDGVRMIGESEGKDSAAIDISKFRQLESNINEDFQREEVEVPAKGVLFGNGFRLKPPGEREEQFTRKCIINSKRLGTALVRTSDLHRVAIHLLDYPDDDAFKVACRSALENTFGDIVVFPAS